MSAEQCQQNNVFHTALKWRQRQHNNVSRTMLAEQCQRNNVNRTMSSTLRWNDGSVSITMSAEQCQLNDVSGTMSAEQCQHAEQCQQKNARWGCSCRARPTQPADAKTRCETRQAGRTGPNTCVTNHFSRQFSDWPIQQLLAFMSVIKPSQLRDPITTDGVTRAIGRLNSGLLADTIASIINDAMEEQEPFDPDTDPCVRVLYRSRSNW